MVYSGRFFVKHDVCIGRVVIHPCGERGFTGFPERITGFRMFFHPLAEIQYGGFPGSEINKRVFFQHKQNIQVIRQFPVHLVCADVCRHIRGINQKDRFPEYPVSVCQYLVIATNHVKPVKIAVAPVVTLP